MSKKKIKDLPLEKRLLCLSILVLFVLLVIFLIFIKHKENGYPIKNVINDNATLTKIHCLDEICIKGMRVDYYKDSISSISGFIMNNGEGRRDACVKIKFIINGQEETIDFNTCYYDLGVDEEVPIETYFDEDQKELLFATDYKLEYLSDEELKQLYETREKDENN